MLGGLDSLTVFTVLPGALGEREVGAYYLMEHSTAQKIYQLRHLQASWLGYCPYTESTQFNIRSASHSRRSVR